MRLLLLLLSCVIACIAADLPGLPTTHIIRLNRHMNKARAHEFIHAQHRRYLKRGANSSDIDSEAMSAVRIKYINLGRRLSFLMGNFSDASFGEFLDAHPDVAYVEPNNVFHLATTKTGLASSWGLARIHQHTHPNLTTYTYDENAGNGVNVYVLDTGVFGDHVDISHRVASSVNFVIGESEEDLNGHGTHVAAKIGGRIFGVAKAAALHSVKILDKSGQGSTASILQGIAHVAKNAAGKKSVINLSLDGPKSRTVDDALTYLAKTYNVPIVVSAGNSGSDACHYTPADNPDVLAVGATDYQDNVAPYSNLGACVGIYAPGTQIESAWIGSPYAVKMMDGTSMASPHVAGIAATLLAKDSFSTVKAVYDAIINQSTKDILTFKNASSSHNRLAYNPI